MLLLVQIFLFFSIVQHCTGSLGDTSHEFSFCKDTCVASKCVKNKEAVDWWLKLTGWSCQDNCLYSCMHEVTAEGVRLGKPIRQFFGKVKFHFNKPGDVFVYLLWLLFAVAICTTAWYSGACFCSLLYIEWCSCDSGLLEVPPSSSFYLSVPHSHLCSVPRKC